MHIGAFCSRGILPPQGQIEIDMRRKVRQPSTYGCSLLRAKKDGIGEPMGSMDYSSRRKSLWKINGISCCVGGRGYDFEMKLSQGAFRPEHCHLVRMTTYWMRIHGILFSPLHKIIVLANSFSGFMPELISVDRMPIVLPTRLPRQLRQYVV